MLGGAPLCVWLLSSLCWWHTGQAACPWEDKDLLSWNDRMAWPDGVPKVMDEAVIESGKHVLLDSQPVNLSTLTIKPGASLVWGNVDDLVLETHYLLIYGKFFIGSEDCRFTKKANIRLYGRTDDKYIIPEEEFARKFVGVMPNGTLEMHGKKKTSWTKLAQTVKPIRDLNCSVVYNHTTSRYSADQQNGAHVIVWNSTDASVVDYNVFKSGSKVDDMKTFFETLPDGLIVGVFVFGKDGVGKKGVEGMEDALLGLGGSIVSDVKEGDSYAFICRLGYPNTVQEFMKKDGQSEPDYTGYLQLHDKESKLIFQVSKCSKEDEYFQVLNEDAARPVLTLVDDVEGWEVGDYILVTSTDFDWRQAEVRRIVECGDDCAPNNIRVNESFAFLHYGNFTNYVDERAEVAILTRNIKIEGIMDAECNKNTARDRYLCDKYNKRDTFGGHVRVASGAKMARIRGVELYNVGQQADMGHYPLHFHMLDTVDGMYMKENSVHESYSRCLVIHGTNGLVVTDNVCYRHLGHGLFIEDGVEQNNTISGNLVLGTEHGTLLMSDMKKEWCKTEKKGFESNCGDLSTYWLTHPTNNITGNVAAGGDGNGYMYVFADLPLGPSRDFYQQQNRSHIPKEKPLYFTKNVGHSNVKSGVFVDSKVSTGTGMEKKIVYPENSVIQSENELDPHVDGKPVWSNMTYCTFYKNGEDNMWVKGGNIIVAYCTLADAPEGFSGGTTLFETGTEVYKSIFIGETGNKGYGRKRQIPAEVTKAKKKGSRYFPQSFAGLPTDSLTAVGMYQGPIFIRSCFFDKYVTKSWCLNDTDTCPPDEVITRHAGALSFKRSNNYPTMTSTYVEDNTFGFCDEDEGKHWVYQGGPEIPDWNWKDGNKMVFFRDKDGKLTGTVNASVVPDTPLYGGDECLKRPDWGDLMVCPYRYVKFELLGTGSLEGKLSKEYPLVIQRDDEEYDEPFSISGWYDSTLEKHSQYTISIGPSVGGRLPVDASKSTLRAGEVLKCEIRNEFLLRTHRSYIIDYNNTNNARYPDELKLFGYGVEKQDVVRIGICQPKGDLNFEIRMDYPAVIRNNATWVTSLAELDADTTGRAFFFEEETRILYFKMLSFHQDTNETQRCPDGKCWFVKIMVNGGDFKDVESCIPNVTPFKDTTERPKMPKKQSCPSTKMPEGLGAIDWDNVGYIEYDDYEVPCMEPQPSSVEATLHGCYSTKSKKLNHSDLAEAEHIEMGNTMTADMCANRCYHRKYGYAALSRGSHCTCGNYVNEALEAKDSQCSEKCPGGGSKTCGGKNSKVLQVYLTGRPTD